MEHFELFPKNLKLNLEIVGHLVFPNTFMFWFIWPDSNLSFFFGGGGGINNEANLFSN